MAASYNRVMILGSCGRDPEVRYMPSGKAVATISVATSNRWKDRETGEDREETQWHRITFYERQAEIVGQYVKKGTSLFVEGELKYGKFTDKDGIERYTTEIIARNIQLTGSPNGERHTGAQGGDDGYGDGGGNGRDSAPARGNNNPAANRPQGNSNPQQPRGNGGNGGYPASGSAPRGNNTGNQGNGGYSSNAQAPRGNGNGGGGGGGGGYSGGNAPQGRGPAPQQNRGPAGNPQRPAMGGNGGFPNEGNGGFDVMDPDIPF